MERVRLGLIGTGTWGKVHAETYASYPRASLVAVCDLNEERARHMASRYGVPHTYTDYRKMLAEAEIDAVAVVTPDFAHREIIVDAARAGKHIIVEKPLATSIEDLDRIAEAVSQAGIKFMVDFHCRWCHRAWRCLLRDLSRPCQPIARSQVPISLAATLAWCSSLPIVKKPWNWPGNVR